MGNKAVYSWSAIDRVGTSAITFVGNLVMARLLNPDDFGLLAMVAIFLAIAQNLSSCGFSDGLIHESDPSPHDYSTTFVFNAALGLIFAVLFAATGPLLAKWFDHPQLTGIMIALGICFLFQTLCFTQETRMRKELDMRGLAVVRIASAASAVALGIVLAINGFGYWALVATQGVVSVFSFVYFMLWTRWIPRPKFYMESFRRLFGYGVHLMMAYVVNQIGRNINTSVLGKYTSATASGLYFQAQKLEEVPYAITESVFNWPFFAVLCNETDPARRRILSSQMHSMLWAVNLFIAGLLLLVSLPAFNLLYGAKWDAAVPVFRLLLIYGVATSMKYFYQVTFKAHGKTRLVRNLTLAEVCLQLLLLAVFFRHGIMMIALTQVIATLTLMLIHIVYYMRLSGIGARTVLAEAFVALGITTLATAVTAGAAIAWYATASPLTNCVALSTVFIVAFVAICHVFRPNFYNALKEKVLTIIKSHR